MKIQEWLYLDVWPRWALGQQRKGFVRMQKPKDSMPGAEPGWCRERRGGICFLMLYKCQEAERLQQPREEAFAKAEAFPCHRLNKPPVQNMIQNTV